MTKKELIKKLLRNDFIKMPLSNFETEDVYVLNTEWRKYKVTLLDVKDSILESFISLYKKDEKNKKVYKKKKLHYILYCTIDFINIILFNELCVGITNVCITTNNISFLIPSQIILSPFEMDILFRMCKNNNKILIEKIKRSTNA